MDYLRLGSEGLVGDAALIRELQQTDLSAAAFDFRALEREFLRKTLKNTRKLPELQRNSRSPHRETAPVTAWARNCPTEWRIRRCLCQSQTLIISLI